MTTPDRLVHDLRSLGVGSGDHLMVHASLRRIGPVEGGADGVLDALDRAVGPEGTLLMIVGARDVPEWLAEPTPAEAAAPPPGTSPFDPERTPAHAEVGRLAEVFRTRPGTIVTDHPLGRFGARGRLAARLLANAPWHDYYGPGSPLERLVAVSGRVLRLGADPDTVTLIHHAEYLVPLPAKRRLRRWTAVRWAAGAVVRHVDALDDESGIVDWEGEDYFGLILKDYLAAGAAVEGRVGNAASELIDAPDLLRFAVQWMAERFATRVRGGPNPSPVDEDES
jgi:aminoglycoside N3'-acetyltransferase